MINDRSRPLLESSTVVTMRAIPLALSGVLLLGLGLGSAPSIAAAQESAAKPTAGDGHARMLALLDAIARDGDEVSPFLGVKVLRDLRERWEKRKAIAPPMERWLLLRKLCKEELKQGNEEAAIQAGTGATELVDALPFDKVDKKLLPGDEGKVVDLTTYYHNTTWFELGMAYMRYGESQNCCLRNTSESCILPLRGSALHTAKEGSEGAIKCFENVLAHRPAQPDPIEYKECEAQARWLLNVAYMTLGEYPKEVPEQWLVDVEKLFHSEVDFPRFENVMPALGLDTFDLSGGAIVDDFDGDDYLDILLSSWDTRGPMHYFENEKDGTFRDRTEAANLKGLEGGLNMWQGDYDNDGDLDVVIPRGAWMAEWGKHPTSLLRNDGHGVFTDVALDVGLERARFPGKTGGFADYDLDGDLDLYIAFDFNPGYTDALPQFYRNNGDGTFTECAKEVGLQDPIYAMGVSWGDYDEDRYPDLMVACLNNKANANLSRLYHNERNGTFRDVTKEAGITPNPAPFPCWFWDFDNDGHLDIYLSCRAGTVSVLADSSLRACWDSLWKGDGKGHFVDVAKQVGITHPSLPMGSNFGDLNGDGWLDMYLGTGNADYSELHPNVMYLSEGAKHFTNVTMAGGFGHLQKGHGVAFADLDSDGDQDVYIQMGGAFPGDKFSDALFENPGFGNHWLKVRLVGTQSNRSGIGARLRAIITEDGVQRSVYQTVGQHGSFGNSPFEMHLGLGRAQKVDALEVFWPVTSTTQVFRDLPVDRRVRIVEGSALPEVRETRPLPFKK